MTFIIATNFDTTSQIEHKEVVDVPQSLIREIVQTHINSLNYAARQDLVEQCNPIGKTG